MHKPTLANKPYKKVFNKKRKKKKILTIYIKCTRKNTIITVVNKLKKVLFNLTSRSYPYKIRKKNTSLIFHKLAFELNKRFRKRKVTHVNICQKGIGFISQVFIKVLKKSYKINYFKLNLLTPFNGCRPPKQKRR